MHRRLISKIAVAPLLLLVLASPALAAPPLQSPASSPPDWAIFVVGLTFLLPAGLILLSAAAFRQEQAVSALTGGLVAWGLASVAYFAAGFAFQFGGIAISHQAPDLAGLYWEYSPLDTTWGTGWGMIGLKGFLLLNEASTPGALTLFLSQLPLLGMAALILYFALHGRAPRWVILLASLLMGSLLYPIIGNWSWAGGWLANLGRNLDQGHGLVDAGGSGQVALVGAAAALAALLVFRQQASDATPEETQSSVTDSQALGPVESAEEDSDHAEQELIAMPPAHLPLLGLLGAMLLVIGWMGTALMTHLPAAVDALPAPMIANLVLSALGGALTAGLYSWFTTSQLNPLMSARGLAAGVVVAAAGSAFIPPWSALAAGLVVGLLLPPLIFLFDRVLRLEDTGGLLGTFGLPGLLGLLLPALVADGRYGQGWNATGAASFQGVAGQGVSGFLAAQGFSGDWPGQLYAQLVGAAAILVWSGGLSWLLLRGLAGLIHAWERSGLEFGAPPQPVAVDEALELDEVEATGLKGGPQLAEPDVG